MRHLNGDLLCAIAINTSGPKPFHHDLIEIGLIPVELDYKVHSRIPPVQYYIKPGRIHNIEKIHNTQKLISKCMATGLDYYESTEYFLKWFESLELRFGKRIMPLSYRYQEVAPFLMDWLQSDYSRIFSENVRDICSVALTANDRAALKGIDFPYPKYDLGYIRSRTGVSGVSSEDTLETAYQILETYKIMIRQFY